MLRGTVLRWVADVMCLLLLLACIVQVHTHEQHTLSALFVIVLFSHLSSFCVPGHIISYVDLMRG
jgi:hypothetical protein